MEDDKVLHPYELEDREDIMDQISGSKDEIDYDPDDDTLDTENEYGLYNFDNEEPPDLRIHGGYDSSDDESEDDDDDLLGKADEDID